LIAIAHVSLSIALRMDGEPLCESTASTRVNAPTPRASALADVYRHAAALAATGDFDGARAMQAARDRILGLGRDTARSIDARDVIGIAEERERRGRR
jgi:hypothetical protein